MWSTSTPHLKRPGPVLQRVRVQIPCGQEPLALAGELAHALPTPRQLRLERLVLLQQTLDCGHAVAALTDYHQLLLLAVRIGIKRFIKNMFLLYPTVRRRRTNAP